MRGLEETRTARTYMDLAAEPGDFITVEILPELVQPEMTKLYVHINGKTILRICKIHNKDTVFTVTDERGKRA